jgi:hypothetical protein
MTVDGNILTTVLDGNNLATSPTLDLLDGIGQTLAAAGLVTYPLATGATYAPTDTALAFARMPADPDRCVVLTDYAATDAAANPWSQIRVQLRTRGLPNRPDDVWALRDGIYALLQSVAGLTFGSVTVAQCLRVSSIPMGQDANLRFMYADNYAFDVQVPATVNRP